MLWSSVSYTLVSHATPPNLRERGVWWLYIWVVLATAFGHIQSDSRFELLLGNAILAARVQYSWPYVVWDVFCNYCIPTEQLYSMVTRPSFSWDWRVWLARLVTTVQCHNNIIILTIILVFLWISYIHYSIRVCRPCTTSACYTVSPVAIYFL